jgi:hypothetical protein
MADQTRSAADDAIVRGRVAATWAFRTRAEVEAAARFERMTSELAEIGATEVVRRGCAEAAADERRHRDLCARIATEWGAPDAVNHEAPRNRIGRSDMDPRDRLLWELVAVCCISETMNVSLMARCLEVARNERIRSTLHELLKDEVRHSRLGWAHLAAESAAGRGQFLGDVLPLMLEASVEPGFLDTESPTPWTDALYEYGELPWAELVRIFRETLTLVIFPGLDAAGVTTSAGRAWLQAHSP